jgi:hypothetical protein
MSALPKQIEESGQPGRSSRAPGRLRARDDGASARRGPSRLSPRPSHRESERAFLLFRGRWRSTVSKRSRTASNTSGGRSTSGGSGGSRCALGSTSSSCSGHPSVLAILAAWSRLGAFMKPGLASRKRLSVASAMQALEARRPWAPRSPFRCLRIRAAAVNQ